MTNFVDHVMRRRIDTCLEKVALILDSNRNGVIASAEQVSHQYDDKYVLANHLTNTTLVCYVNCLEVLGFDRSRIQTLKGWASRRAVSLAFEKSHRCKFIKEIERDVEDPSRVQVDGIFGRTTVKVVTKVKEYIYSYQEVYALKVFSGVGTDASESMTIHESTSQMTITTRTNQAPFNEASMINPDVNITWLLNRLNATAEAATFEIDRSKDTCCTPRQNTDVEGALKFASEFAGFCSMHLQALMATHEVYTRYRVPNTCKIDIAGMTAQDLFNPIVPLFENRDSTVSTPTALLDQQDQQVAVQPAEQQSAVALPRLVVNQLLAEHRRSLEAKCAQMNSLFFVPEGEVTPAGTTPQIGRALFTVEEAKRVVVLQHLKDIKQNFEAAVTFIEQMIRAQLVAAVGKELAVKDFAQYMTFHNRKVFKEQYQPKPFSYAVRRSPAHCPEGQIQIETAAVTPAEPIYTVSHGSANAAYMEFALNATTTVKFGGERHLHGWMAHRFSDQALPELKLIAQARQFSSYIVLIGRIASAKLFQPKYGFIVQNKDEISIPLELEQIPTAKEFKDAISSLSPEQQRFAKAFRSMQLESTLFGVCVIQIKPQLEKVLKLQADSLTKEIKLTQDLMQLFIKYQIPTDLLSYEQGLIQVGEASAADRLVLVKKHVQAMQEMLAAAKEEEVAEQNLVRELMKASIEKTLNRSERLDDVAELSTVRCDSIDLCDRSEMLEQQAVQFNKSASNMKKGGGGMMGMLLGTSSGSKSAGYTRTSSTNSDIMPKSVLSSSVRGESMQRNRSDAAPAKVANTIDVTAGLQLSAAKVVESSAPPPARAPTARPTTVATATVPSPAAYSNSVDAPEDYRGEQVDYTKYPNLLEEMYTKYDPAASLRPTIINPGSSWTKRFQAGLLSTPVTKALGEDQQAQEKNAAFDLLDALTRSGGLPVEHASLHVIIAATHCFDQSLMDTVVKKNVNPIERVERSTLIMAAALNGVPAVELIGAGQVERVSTFSPMLFGENSLNLLSSGSPL